MLSQTSQLKYHKETISKKYGISSLHDLPLEKEADAAPEESMNLQWTSKHYSAAKISF